MREPGTTKFQIDLRRHLREQGEDRDLIRLICEIAEASKYIVNAIRTGDLGVAGTSNLYGEEQLALDVLSDRILRKRLTYCGVVANMVSEESGEIINISDEDMANKYSVAFDPLDGSSLVDVNLAVGTVVSIYRGPNLLQPGYRQVAALYILYGPRTTLLLTTGDGVWEFGMNQLMEYTLCHEQVTLAPEAKLYSPGGLRQQYTPGTLKWLQELEARGVKLRYSGGLVPDMNQILLKGQGVFCYPHTYDNPEGKLRLLFELNPMAMLVEQAGGCASTGRERILDIRPKKVSQRAPVFMGSQNEVALAQEYIAACES